MADNPGAIPENLTELEGRLRKAIERRQYTDLPQLLENLRGIAAEHRRPEIAARVRATIGWALLMVTAQRQTWADDLERLPLLNRYLERSQETAPVVCVDL